jgi:hypothetical protein
VPQRTSTSTDLQKLLPKIFIYENPHYSDSKASEATLQNELDKVAKAYGGGAGVDMTAFPSFSYQEVEVEPINIAQKE